ncbi:hypothetical protein SZ55_1318 [Pseudomonas sp. FeS53a]|nr:hypothetical protein SZ55_1318 [Pseudomonas sp. FeS53a]
MSPLSQQKIVTWPLVRFLVAWYRSGPYSTAQFKQENDKWPSLLSSAASRCPSFWQDARP